MDRISSSIKASFLSPFNGLSYYPNYKKTMNATGFMNQVMFDQSLTKTLERLEIPTLLIYGRLDLVAPVEVGEYMLNHIATDEMDKKLVVLEESRYGAEGSDIVLFQDSIIEFIENLK